MTPTSILLCDSRQSEHLQLNLSPTTPPRRRCCLHAATERIFEVLNDNLLKQYIGDRTRTEWTQNTSYINDDNKIHYKWMSNCGTWAKPSNKCCIGRVFQRWRPAVFLIRLASVPLWYYSITTKTDTKGNRTEIGITTQDAELQGSKKGYIRA